MDSTNDKAAVRKRIEKSLGRRALQVLSRIALVLPDSVALGVGRMIGSLAYYASRRYRTVAINNLTVVFGDTWDRSRIAATAREMFRHIGMSLIEFLRFPGVDPNWLDEIIRVEGEEHVKEALRQGHGILAITSHYGNFELFGAAFVHRGYKLSVIARNADDEKTNDLINGIRERMGYKVFPRQQAAFRSVMALRRNEILGVLPDQNDLDGIFVPFFGRLASTTRGPAVMAIRTGAVVLPAFIHREPDNTHVVTVYPPLDYEETDDPEQNIYNLTLAINRAIETAILKHPEQWFWLHNRWKKRPPEELAQTRDAAPSGTAGSLSAG